MVEVVYSIWPRRRMPQDVASGVMPGQGGPPGPRRLTSRVVLLWLMGLLAVAYVGGLALPGSAENPVVDLWLGLLTQWTPAAVCWLTVRRVGIRRWDGVLLACAASSFAAGNTYYVLAADATGSPPFPSLGDVGYLGFYPLILAALALAVRHRLRGQASSVWLDSLVGSLGAAAVLAVLLDPVVASAMKGSVSLATVVAVAYPSFDLLLVAAVTGIVTLGGGRIGSRWGFLVAGLMVFAATDVSYALEVTAETYVIGSPLDAGWAIALALVAFWGDGAIPPRPLPQEPTPVTGSAALVVSALAAVAGVAVLVMSSRTQLSTMAVGLAAVALLAAAARTQVAFRQLVRMADLRHQATTDHLTGLPNRRSLYAQAEARMTAEEPWPQALLLLDLDRFKEVNDSLGHHTGDELLIQVGRRLGCHLRSGDLLVRLGGDEFAVLLDNAGYDQADAVAAKLCESLAEPFTLDGIAIHSSVSIGITLFPYDGPDLSTLLRKADVAMYRAKASGDCHHVYSDADDSDSAMRLQTVEELRIALSTNQLVVHYQPQIELLTGEVRGVEALVRWLHPTRGLLYPDAFLDLVEQFGLMRALTREVLQIALDQALLWHADGRRLTVAVNLSPSTVVDIELPDRIADMLKVRALPPHALQLEITEESLMADRDQARSILTRLRQNGIQISVDDFGSGYSSLAYLRDLPVDELKIDRSFVQPMADDARAAALVAATIGLAHSLGLRAVAEGVEDNVAYAELVRMGCDMAQGYFMSRPVPAAELDIWLSARDVTNPLPDISDPWTVAALD